MVTRVTRSDKWLIVLLLTLAFCLLALNAYFIKAAAKEAEGVVIVCRGKQIGFYPFDGKNRKIKVEGRLGTSVVEIGRNKARMFTSPCPKHVCVLDGWIASRGEVIVCAPNEVVIRVSGKLPFDAVSR